MSATNVATGIAVLLICTHSAVSHTFLTHPDAYNRVFQLRNCVGSECRQACPSVVESRDMRNTASAPAAVWRRGAKVTINWARNNHRTGFVRFSIVPVERKMERAAHAKLALFHGCFDQGQYRCGGALLCGADGQGLGYRRNLTVPSIFADGLYVFGLVWYGGVHSPLSAGKFFSDYWSCSYIRIAGGVAAGGRHQPFFDAGDNVQASKNDGKCLTGVDGAGVCGNEGCTGPWFYGLPKEYKGGKKPGVLTKAAVNAVRRG